MDAAFWGDRSTPQRDSNPCRHLERANLNSSIEVGNAYQKSHSSSHRKSGSEPLFDWQPHALGAVVVHTGRETVCPSSRQREVVDHSAVTARAIGEGT